MEFANYRMSVGGQQMDLGDDRKNRAANMIGHLELLWKSDRRPYYRVWPCVVEMFCKMSLAVKWSQLTMPLRCLSVSFPKPYWPTLKACLLAWLDHCNKRTCGGKARQRTEFGLMFGGPKDGN